LCALFARAQRRLALSHLLFSFLQNRGRAPSFLTIPKKETVLFFSLQIPDFFFRSGRGRLFPEGEHSPFPFLPRKRRRFVFLLILLASAGDFCGRGEVGLFFLPNVGFPPLSSRVSPGWDRTTDFLPFSLEDGWSFPPHDDRSFPGGRFFERIGRFSFPPSAHGEAPLFLSPRRPPPPRPLGPPSPRQQGSFLFFPRKDSRMFSQRRIVFFLRLRNFLENFSDGYGVIS